MQTPTVSGNVSQQQILSSLHDNKDHDQMMGYYKTWAQEYEKVRTW